jgi:hypothetical protein
MQYTERLPYVPSPRTLAVPLVALVLGAGAATGLYTLVDNDGTSVTPGDTRVIVADPPAQPGEGVAAKNEAGVASAIGNPALPGEGVSAKDEAGVASAIGRPEQPQTVSKDEAGVGALMGPPNAGSSTETKDEAATAAVIANSGTFASPETKDEAATAAVIAQSKGSTTQTQEEANRTDPHGPAAALP